MSKKKKPDTFSLDVVVTQSTGGLEEGETARLPLAQFEKGAPPIESNAKPVPMPHDLGEEPAEKFSGPIVSIERGVKSRVDGEGEKVTTATYEVLDHVEHDDVREEDQPKPQTRRALRSMTEVEHVD
jgi:hypothetical protein